MVDKWYTIVLPTSQLPSWMIRGWFVVGSWSTLTF